MKFTIDVNALRLYAITSDGAALDPTAKVRIRQWLQAGVRTIQLREKMLDADMILRFGRFVRAITSEYGALFIVNDDPHLAALLEADGCHLGTNDTQVAEARRILGREKIIGVSTHGREDVVQAANQDIDYIGVGPIFQSSSKQTLRPLLGPEFAGWASRQLDIPVVAIGGIHLGNVGQLVNAGCTNVAVISALNRSPRPAEAVRAFLDILTAPDRQPGAKL